jgi:hypothetical protein
VQSNNIGIGMRDQGSEESSVDKFGGWSWDPWVGVDKKVLELCEEGDCGW